MFYSSRVGTGAKAEREAERRGNISCHGGRKGLQRKRKRAKEDGESPAVRGSTPVGRDMHLFCGRGWASRGHEGLEDRIVGAAGDW